MASIFSGGGNGDSGVVKLTDANYITVDISGTFDGSTTTVTVSTDGTTYHAFTPDGTAKTYTTATNEVIHYGNCKLKFAITGGSGSESIDLDVSGRNVFT